MTKHSFRLLACLAIPFIASCGGRSMFVPPAGPGESVPDPSAAWEQATNGCRDLRSVVSSQRVSGRVGAARVWPLTIDAAVLADQSIYLSATASGKPIFLLAGSASRATLWLRTEERAITAEPAAILNALIGVSLSPDEMLGVLSGCVARGASIARASRHGASMTVETSAGRAFLDERAGQWAVRAFDTHGITAEFVAPGRAVPQDIWLWSGAGGSSASLHLNVTERELNGTVPPEVFRVPSGAQAAAPMTLEELAAMWKNRVPLPEDLPCPVS